MKNILYSLLLLILFSCGDQKPQRQKIVVDGYAQGTTYKIIYISNDGIDYQRAIDSTLIAIDNSMSTYQKKSLISKWNQSEDGDKIVFDENFVQVYNISKVVFKETKGLFDPTVAPLVNAWGFGFEKESEITKNVIDSILLLVGFDRLSSPHGAGAFVLKFNSKVMLDFNAVAQGYTVDVLADLLEKKGIQNYLVEVGGELKAKGLNMNDTLWRIGIDKPIAELEEREIEAIVNLENKALATSGNYRKFYEKDGKKYSHTINPKTGYPVEHNLLSATVITDDCGYADAYATSFMVMGLKGTKDFLSLHKEIDALLIYSDENSDLQMFMTEGVRDFIELSPPKK